MNPSRPARRKPRTSVRVFVELAAATGLSFTIYMVIQFF